MKAESYVERWARENAEKKQIKAGDKIEQNSRSEGQKTKKTKSRKEAGK